MALAGEGRPRTSLSPFSSVRPALSLLLLIVLGAVACGPNGATREETVQRPPLSEVVARHAPRLIEVEGIEVVYESVGPDGEPCVKIGVVELTDALRADLPRELDGWPVVVIESGEIRPLD